MITLAFLPLIFMAVAMVASVAGGVIAAVGARQAAKATEEAGKEQAKAAEAAAHNEELQNAEAIRRERVNKRRRLALLRSSMGTRGTVMSDSSEDVFAETAGAWELDVLDAARESSMKASNIRSGGQTALWESRTQATAMRMNSYGTLLTTVGSVAQSGMNMPSKAPKSIG